VYRTNEPIPVAARPKACDSAAASLLGLRVRIMPRAWMSVVSIVGCQGEVPASGRFLVQKSPAECGVCECDREASIIMRPWPTEGFSAVGKKTT
jgi:hypothetical protein